jgi:hypothetical protein
MLRDHPFERESHLDSQQESPALQHLLLLLVDPQPLETSRLPSE